MKNVRTVTAFSLVELMVSLLLLSIALVGVTKLLSSTLFADSDSKTYTAAATLAETRLEQLKSIGFADVTNGNDTTTIDNVAYTRTWVITDVVAYALKKAAVTVSWGNPTRQIALSVYMARE